MGTSGRLLKTTYVSHLPLDHLLALNKQEYAGLPGSTEHTQFLKSTTQAQLSRALYTGSNIVSATSSWQGQLSADRCSITPFPRS